MKWARNLDLAEKNY